MQKQKRFRFGFWPVVFTLTAFGILCKLGFWQLQRAEEKQAWLEDFESKTVLTGMDWEREMGQFGASHLNGRTIALSGSVLSQYLWLVDNRTHQGQAGYKVLAPLLPANGPFAVLVDFGWVAAPKSRAQLPELALPSQISISGIIKSEHLETFMLAADDVTAQWPQRIQSHQSALQAEHPFPIAPFVVFANSNSVEGIPQTYQAVVMKPEKHRAYAVQWFLLALACVAVFLFASYQRPRQADSLEVS